MAFLLLVGAPAVPYDPLLVREMALIEATEAAHGPAFRALKSALFSKQGCIRPEPRGRHTARCW